MLINTEKLVDAISKADINTVRKLINKDNVNDHIDFGSYKLSVLCYAVRNKNMEILSYLIESCEADINVLSVADSPMGPIEFAVAYYKEEIFEYLLSKRSAISEQHLEKILSFCLNHYQVENPNNENVYRMCLAENFALLNYAVSRLTRTDINLILYRPEHRIKFLAHLNQFSGVKRLSTKKGDEISLENWGVEQFLPLHIRICFEILLKLRLGIIKHNEIFKGTISSENVIKMLSDELLSALNCNAISKDLEILRLVRLQHDLDELAAKSLYQAVAKNIKVRLASSQPGEQCIIASGWQKHAVYINLLTKDPGYIEIRIDNLGRGAETYHKEDIEKTGHIFPQVLGVAKADIHFEEYLTKLFQAYHKQENDFKIDAQIGYSRFFSSIFSNKNEENEKEQKLEAMRKYALDAIYNYPIAIEPTVNEYPAMHQQLVSNCTFECYQVNLAIRFKELHQGLLNYQREFIVKEVSLLPRNLLLEDKDFANELFSKEIQTIAFPQFLKEPYKDYLYNLREDMGLLDIAFPIDDKFTDFILVKKLKTVYKRSAVHENITKNIHPNDIINLFNKNKYRELVIIGDSGIGKTITLINIAYKFYTGQFYTSFAAIFYIPFKNLNSYNYSSNATLADMVNQECFKKKLPTWALQRIEQLIEQKEVLWLLDGLEEAPSDMPTNLKESINRLRAEHFIIISARYNSVDLQDNTYWLEIRPQANFNPRYYVKKIFCGQTEIVEKVCNFIDGNRFINPFAANPLFFKFICYLGKYGLLADKLKFKTDVYRHVVFLILKEHLRKEGTNVTGWTEDKVIQRCKTEYKLLSKLAFNLFIEDSKLKQKLSNSVSDIQNILTANLFIKSNTLSENNFSPLENLKFSHQTFQEFFAAKYWLELCKSNREKALLIFKENKYFPEWQGVWQFVVGLDYNAVGILLPLIQESQAGCLSFDDFTLLINLLGETNKQEIIKQFEPIIIHSVAFYLNNERARVYSDKISNMLNKHPYLVEGLNLLNKIRKILGEGNLLALQLILAITCGNHQFDEEVCKHFLDYLKYDDYSISYYVIQLMNELNYFNQEIINKLSSYVPTYKTTLAANSEELEAAKLILTKYDLLENYIEQELYDRCLWFVTNHKETARYAQINIRDLIYPSENGGLCFTSKKKPNFSDEEHLNAAIEEKISDLQKLIFAIHIHDISIPWTQPYILNLINEAYCNNISTYTFYEKIIERLAINRSSHGELAWLVTNAAQLIESLIPNTDIAGFIANMHMQMINMNLLAHFLGYIRDFPNKYITDILHLLNAIGFDTNTDIEESFSIIRWNLIKTLYGKDLSSYRFYNYQYLDIPLNSTPLINLLTEYKSDYLRKADCYSIIMMITQKCDTDDEEFKRKGNALKVYREGNYVSTVVFDSDEPIIFLNKKMNEIRACFIPKQHQLSYIKYISNRLKAGSNNIFVTVQIAGVSRLRFAPTDLDPTDNDTSDNYNSDNQLTFDNSSLAGNQQNVSVITKKNELLEVSDFTPKEFNADNFYLDKIVDERIAEKNFALLPKYTQSNSTPANIFTLGDGNCAFNACALGLSNLIEHGQLPLQARGTQQLFQKLSVKLNLSGDNKEAFLVWLGQHKNLDERQILIAPILRDYIIGFIREYYDDLDLASRYKETLVHAYNLHQAGGVNNDDDTFIVHPHIAAKFKESGLTDEDLADWWNTDDGYIPYFDTLRQSAEHALDKKRWGSEIELNVLAFSLGINITYQKNNNPPQCLGIGSGWLSDLSQQEIEQLRNLEVGQPFLQGFRLYPGMTQDELIQRTGPLPESISALIFNLANQASKDGHRDFPLTITGIDDIVTLRGQLQKRHIIYKQGEIYRFVEENNKIDMAAIQARIQDISEKLRQKLMQCYQGHVAAFQVLHAGAHWSYQATSVNIRSIDYISDNNSKLQVTGQPTARAKPANARASESYQYFNTMKAQLEKLNSLALPEALGGTNEILQYLKNTIKQEDVVISDFEWDMHPDSSQTGAEQLNNYGFPFDSFQNFFLLDEKKNKFILPLLLKQAHFAGLAIIKQADKWQVKYINPTGSKLPNNGEDKEALANIEQALRKLTDKHQIVFKEIEILSNKQQLNESDCAFIVAQTLIDIVSNQAMSIKPYMGNMAAYVKPIAKARANFYSQKILKASYEATIRDHYYSRLAKALTTNWEDYAIPLQELITKASADGCDLDDALLMQLQALINRINRKDLKDCLGSELTNKAIYFLNTSPILKNISLIDIKKFVDKLLEPHFTEEGSLIFKLNSNLQNYANKSKNYLKDISSLKKANSSYSKFFQLSSSNSNKISENQAEAEKQKELAEIEEALVNLAIQESRPIEELFVEFQGKELQQHKRLN